MTNTQQQTALPRWSVADVHQSFDARSFTDAMESAGAGVTRLEALFEEHNIRAVTPRPVQPADGEAADSVINTFNNSITSSSNLTN